MSVYMCIKGLQYVILYKLKTSPLKIKVFYFIHKLHVVSTGKLIYEVSNEAYYLFTIFAVSINILQP